MSASLPGHRHRTCHSAAALEPGYDPDCQTEWLSADADGHTECKHPMTSTPQSTCVKCIPMHFGAFQCILVHSNAFLCIPMHSTAFQCIPLHFSAFQCISVHSNAFQCIAQPNTTLAWLHTVTHTDTVPLWVQALYQALQISVSSGMRIWNPIIQGIHLCKSAAAVSWSSSSSLRHRRHSPSLRAYICSTTRWSLQHH